MSLILETALNSSLKSIAEKVFENKRISFDDALELYESSDILTIGILADHARKARAAGVFKDYAYFINNHHINLTNICEGSCRFCAYRKSADDPEAFFLNIDNIRAYLQKKVSSEIKELHIVSALCKKADLNYYISLFKTCKDFLPDAHIQALTAVEIDYLSRLEKTSPQEILTVLVDAGLGSLPGGGAEIFHESLRSQVCPDKISADRWLEIMQVCHESGIHSNATMLTGIGESYFHRVDHLNRLRNLQDKTGGFLAFIPLVCHYDNTDIDIPQNITGVDNLKDLAIARIFLDNFPHIKAFWIQLGIKLSQISLTFGVDDLDGTVVREKITRAAGASFENYVTKDLLIYLIRNAARTPVERDTVYNIIKVY